MAERYRPETGCAALADRRHDPLFATAPPAARWLLIESHAPWPRAALTALRSNLGTEVARRCAELGYRPVLIRRFGRIDRGVPRKWGLVDCRPGRESMRWGELSSDEHLLDVLAGADPGDAGPTAHNLGQTAHNLGQTAHNLGQIGDEPAYLVCTHGRHDACCAVRGRPVAAALAAAYPERTWECSHIGGDRFAANVVVLPHSLFYGHVSAPRAVELAKHHDEGRVVPDLLRGSGAFIPPVQAAQHYARAAGHSVAVDALLPQAVRQLRPDYWQVDLTTGTTHVGVQLSAHLDTVDARLTCAGRTPSQVRRFALHSLTTS